MKVTPVGKKFGKHELGAVFDLPDSAGKVLTKVGRLKEVTGLGYETRMMAAATTDAAAPWGRKADGTPRARPGRPPAAPAQLDHETAGDAGANGQEEAAE
jgi:hypothetical protein